MQLSQWPRPGRPRYNKSRCFETFSLPEADTGLTPALRHTISHLAEQIDHYCKRVLVLLAVHASTPPPFATSTWVGPGADFCAFDSMRPLALPESTHHEASPAPPPETALSSPVKSAKAKAARDELLLRLVALNARRAAEEANGQVRWLRPEFQNPLSKQELPAQLQQWLEVDLPSNSATLASSTQPWPATLPDQVKAVAQLLATSASALTLAQIEARFTGRGARRKTLPTLLQTLQALGRAQQVALECVMLWRAS